VFTSDRLDGMQYIFDFRHKGQRKSLRQFSSLLSLHFLMDLWV